VQNLFPGGDTMPFINAIFRIFCNKHTEEYLDFKEFLTAMNITTLRAECCKTFFLSIKNHLDDRHF
jgi:hypothetical protein